MVNTVGLMEVKAAKISGTNRLKSTLQEKGKCISDSCELRSWRRETTRVRNVCPTKHTICVCQKLMRAEHLFYHLAFTTVSTALTDKYLNFTLSNPQ